MASVDYVVAGDNSLVLYCDCYASMKRKIHQHKQKSQVQDLIHTQVTGGPILNQHSYSKSSMTRIGTPDISC